MSGTHNFSLSAYFEDDHGQLTYTVSVEDPNVVNATLVGSTHYVQNGLFRDGSSLDTITASDGYASVNDTLNATYSFAAISFSYVTENVYEFVMTAYPSAGTSSGIEIVDLSTSPVTLPALSQGDIVINRDGNYINFNKLMASSDETEEAWLVLPAP